MQYMLLIYSDESVENNMSEAARKELFSSYYAFTEEVKAAGAFIAGDALQPAPTATSVRLRSGEVLTTDGPFAETKEQLGGYYLVEAENLDEAIKWAAKIPTAVHGTIEVRPVMVFE